MSEEVNGMGVSDCVYYTREGACNNGRLSYWCEDNPECYYKQLQRTTIQYNKVVEQNRSLQKELQRKNQEIENLKEMNKAEMEELAKDNNALHKVLKDFESLIEYDCATRCNYYFESPEECKLQNCISSIILQKIKEVENNNVS